MLSTLHLIGDSIEEGEANRAGNKYDCDEKCMNIISGIMITLHSLEYLRRKTVQKVFQEPYHEVTMLN
jgi:hypothetical protein